MVGGVLDAGGDGQVVAVALAVQHLDRQQRGVPTHAGDADSVVRFGRRQRRHQGAVAVVVLGIGVVVDEIVAGHDLVLQILMTRGNAGVDDGDHDAAAAGAPGPAFGGLDVGGGGAAEILFRVIHLAIVGQGVL